MTTTPSLRPLAPEAASFISSRTIWPPPRFDQWYAQAAPVNPAPMTTTSHSSGNLAFGWEAHGWFFTGLSAASQ